MMYLERKKIKFGTDGWRGIIGQDFTFTNLKKVACALALYLTKTMQSHPPRIIIGYDHRFLSERFAAVFAEILSGYKLKSYLFKKAIPTPMLSFLIKAHHFTAGVMITASHNPYLYNGVKIKTALGTSAGVKLTDRLERIINRRAFAPETVISKPRLVDYSNEYVASLEKFLKNDVFRNSQLKVMVDEMYGSQNSLIERILRKKGVDVKSINNIRNPFFGGINPEPISQNLKKLSQLVKREKFDLGLATDGDADRIGAVCPNGAFITSHQIIALLALHLIRNRNWSGTLAKTINTTVWLDRIAKKYNLKIYETSVGFKHLSRLMLKHDILIAGEESGGIAFKNYIPERDGILSGLLLVEMLCMEKRGIRQILFNLQKEFGRFFYLREDVWLKNKSLQVDEKGWKRINRILDQKVMKIDRFDGIKFKLADDSWLLLRFSGTEPLLRIYAEGTTKQQAERLVAYGKELVCKTN
ncbi:MAG: phosphoglucomutase/phosphomannomutase family protein [Candidatus Omnitrophota bacterium]